MENFNEEIAPAQNPDQNFGDAKHITVHPDQPGESPKTKVVVPEKFKPQLNDDGTIPDPLDLPKQRPMAVVPVPGDPEVKPLIEPQKPHDVATEPSRGRLATATRQGQKVKISPPNGVYFLAGLMFLPLFTIPQGFIVAQGDFVRLFTILHPSVFLAALMWICAIFLGISAILLVIRWRPARIIAIVALLFISVLHGKLTFDIISFYNKPVEQDATVIPRPLTNTEFNAIRMQTINQAILAILPLVAIVYLSLPHVRRAFKQ
ncbi:hypothetical protein FWG95_01065 [Candidatus Saccharibacteria bacterium]|nr:hypothetical protein [Candidatus Saccharibacteria bacterium]